MDVTQLLVAIGTLALASATFWLGWNSRQERKTAKARELAIGVYNPLRNDVLQWVESEPSYSNQLSETWPSLKRSQLHLIASVPKPITTKLDDVEPDIRRANFLKEKVTAMVQELWAKLAGESYPQAQFQGNLPWMYTFFRLMIDGKKYVRLIDPVIVWLSRKSIRNYVEEYVSKQYPGENWILELMVGNLTFSETEKAGAYGKKVFEALDGDKNAIELRDLLETISAKGKAINTLIEAELKKG